jgi:hypothetical protein
MVDVCIPAHGAPLILILDPRGFRALSLTHELPEVQSIGQVGGIGCFP